MASFQSSSPSRSSQASALCEQKRRLSAEAPQLLAAIEVLLPLAKAQLRDLTGPVSAGSAATGAESTKSQADAWAVGITLADEALARIRPCSHVLLRYLLALESALIDRAVRP
jgi:hypothetical protein